jgi:hypothetical protein
VDLSSREFWALVHGLFLGGAYLLAFSGGLSGFYSLRPDLLSEAAITQGVRRLRVGTVAMAVLTWLTVIVGTWIVYPWYRAKTPDSPRSHLLASPNTKGWHEFAMEWKEHVGWLSPMLATAAAFIVVYYGVDLTRNPLARRIATGLFIGAFAIAVVAGLLGALITKKAPIT